MADTVDNPTANKSKTKRGAKFKRFLPDWLKRPKSGNRSTSQPNSTRISVSSTSGAHDPDPGNNAEGSEPTASGSNTTSLQNPTAPFQSPTPHSLAVPDRSGSAVDQGHGSEATRTPAPTAQPAPANPPAQVSDWKVNAKEGLGVASRFAQTLLKKVPDCVDGNPVKMAFSIAKMIMEIKDTVTGNKDELEEDLKKTAKRLLAVKEKVVSAEAAKDAMKKLEQSLGEEMRKLEELSNKWLLTRILDHEDYKQRIPEIFQRVEEAMRFFQFEMVISIQNTTTSIEQTAALKRLHPSHRADHKTVLEEKALKREECTTGTRVKILEDIAKWANDSSSESSRVFWLTGQAGSGKTTIAYTIAKLFENSGSIDQPTVLGANFFCSRQFEETRQCTRVIPTIAYQLARKCKPYADALHVADKFDTVNYDISTQVKDLLVGPWQQSKATRNEELPPYLIVIDALDELEGDGGPAFLQDLFAAIDKYDLRGFKFLMTSRSDPEIVELPFASEAILWLQHVPIEEVELDIGMYLKTKLPQLAGSPELAELGRRTGGLFIYAATAVKHLTHSRSITRGEQVTMLSELLSNSKESDSTNDTTFLIDELYRQIMRDTFSKYKGKLLTHRLRILHTILCTAERTSTSTVAALFMEGGDNAVVSAVAKDLHAVLYIQDDHVYWYHASFPDFIFDRNRSNFRVGEDKFEFGCNEPGHHNLLGQSCFRIMTGLRFNMGDIQSSFLFDSDNTDVLSEKVQMNINAVLRYSCCHWTHHLPSPHSIDTENLVHCISNFLNIRVLFWIEVMNLLGLSNQCTPMLQAARQWMLKCGVGDSKLASDVGEAANFATYFTGSPAAKSTPHLYISALATWSRNTSLCRNWKQRFAQIPVITHTKGSVDLPLMTLSTESNFLTVAFSSDGMRIVSSLHDNSMRVWDASTGVMLKELNGHTSLDTVDSVAFSSNGMQIVSGSRDGSVRVWDASTGAELKQLNGHTAYVLSVAFSSDGMRIVSASSDKSVRVWDALAGVELKKLNGHTKAVISAAFSTDGTRIVSGSIDNSVRVWDTSAGVQLKVLNGHAGWVKSVAFSTDGTRIASGSDDNSVRVWDASTGAQLKELNGHTRWVDSVAFSSDGMRIVSGSADNSVRVWDASTGAELKKLNGHTSEVHSVAFSNDGTRIMSGSYDRSVRVWDASIGAGLKELSGHTNSVDSVAFSSDSTRIVSGSRDNSVRVWDASTGSELKKLSGHTSSVHSVAFLTDSTQIMSGSYDNSVRTWDVSTGTQLKELSSHNGLFLSVAFSNDGTRIVSGSDDNSLRVSDASTGVELKELNGHTSWVDSVAFSSDGMRIVSGSNDNSVRVWDVPTGVMLQELNGHTDRVHSVAFSSDGMRIVSGSRDESVRIWDASTGAELKKLSGHTDSVRSVAFSSDGTRIVSGSVDATVRVWDASTGLALQVLNGHTKEVNSVAFSTDGTRIVSGSHDQSVRVWNVEEYMALHERTGHTNSHNSSTSLNDDQFSWHLTETNWIISSQGQNHLMWVPQQMQIAHPSTLIISRHGFASVDFRHSLLGADWVGCYTP